MDKHPYHNYLFFKLDNGFYRLPAAEQEDAKVELYELLSKKRDDLMVTSYLTIGFRPDTTFLLWCRGSKPETFQELVGAIGRTDLGQHLDLTHTYFGMVRNSEYSGRTGKPEQVIQNYEERMPYFVVYPFTKTHEWHAMPFEERKSMMGEHVKVGLGHPNIRQCLLYSYGVDDYEFVVSYETESLEEFQDLVIQMRRTAGRKYTLVDIPTHTCIYKPLSELIKFL